MLPGEVPRMEHIRFRTLGCYPLTGAIRSEAGDAAGDHRGDARLDHVGARRAALIDHDESGSMEKKKREGYF